MSETELKFLDIDSSSLRQQGGLHTAQEISQQPDLWQKVWSEVRSQQSALREFFDAATQNSERIIITGAGTSAFIGLSLTGLYQRKTRRLVQEIPTTDLVSHPGDYLIPGQAVFLISFARSGNSPESVAAASIVEEISGRCYHLVITCNAEGRLAEYGRGDRRFMFSLPSEANDQSLAMTSSYTGMLLALLGTTLVASTVGSVLGFVLAIISLGQKARMEEQFLMVEFRELYTNYQREVKFLIPFIY